MWSYICSIFNGLSVGCISTELDYPFRELARETDISMLCCVHHSGGHVLYGPLFPILLHLFLPSEFLLTDLTVSGVSQGTVSRNMGRPTECFWHYPQDEQDSKRRCYMALDGEDACTG